MRLTPTFTLVIVGFAMSAIVGTALLFEHWGGYVPCALCLTQRTPYYIGILIALVGLLIRVCGGSDTLIRLCLLAILCALITTAGIGIYHSGIEWELWAGPASCSASVGGTTSDASSLLSELATTKPPSCDKAAARFLKLSFAGWNVISASALIMFTIKNIKK